MNNLNYKDFYTSLPEAQLINKLREYAGGVVYKLYDANTYKNVKLSVLKFAKKNSLQVVTEKFNPKKSVGYFYFRIGADPAKESQKIQGFMSQLPEVVKFKFKVI